MELAFQDVSRPFARTYVRHSWLESFFSERQDQNMGDQKGQILIPDNYGFDTRTSENKSIIPMTFGAVRTQALGDY